jgi:tetratricopeptide (TPR) repeat protein
MPIHYLTLSFLLLSSGHRHPSGDLRETLARAEMQLVQREASLGPNHPAVGIALDDVAKALASLHRYYEAEPLIQRAINIQEMARQPRAAAAARNTLGTLFFFLDDPEGAIRQFRRALDWLDAAGPLPDRARVMYNLGVAQLSLPDYPAARASFDQAEAIARQFDEPADPLMTYLVQARSRLPKRFR